MSRLGVLYAITNEELAELKKQKKEEIYDYMLENIEEEYLGGELACELDKAWYALHYAINNGEWKEDKSTLSKVIFGGEFLLDDEEYVITLKKPDDVKEIVEYLTAHEKCFDNVIENGFKNTKDDDLDLPKDENLLEYMKDWSKGLLPFYKNAEIENLNVIFTTDL
ncbi:DUF1877 family protein [Fusobacterium sp. PH5-44]|uniref:DUF1877 family protein n=1 Tax=unclassified Fusobacterium TaxID=2648384 RepID=UPI003D244225